jgi:hypothetical protein
VRSARIASPKGLAPALFEGSIEQEHRAERFTRTAVLKSGLEALTKRLQALGLTPEDSANQAEMTLASREYPGWTSEERSSAFLNLFGRDLSRLENAFEPRESRGSKVT